jgi:predicted XRE-type DNA-binding protein
MLLEEFLIPMNITQRELANAIHVPYQRINDLVNGRSSKPSSHTSILQAQSHKDPIAHHLGICRCTVSSWANVGAGLAC